MLQHIVDGASPACQLHPEAFSAHFVDFVMRWFAAAFSSFPMLCLCSCSVKQFADDRSSYVELMVRARLSLFHCGVVMCFPAGACVCGWQRDGSGRGGGVAAVRAPRPSAQHSRVLIMERKRGDWCRGAVEAVLGRYLTCDARCVVCCSWKQRKYFGRWGYLCGVRLC